MNAKIEIAVELRNPGQFFACCGVLELADRMSPGAIGAFQGSTFQVGWYGTGAPADPLAELLSALRPGQMEIGTPRPEDRDVDPADDPVCPLILGKPLRVPLRLDWWLTPEGGTTPFKCWAGQMKSARIVEDLRRAWDGLADRRGPAFDRMIPLSGRFGFDPRSSWNALDVGFSPNEQKITVVTAPAVELLAAVGLQRFRPRQEVGRSFSYIPWATPAAPEIAAALCCGAVPSRGRPHVFAVESRGKYKSFAFATCRGADR